MFPMGASYWRRTNFCPKVSGVVNVASCRAPHRQSRRWIQLLFIFISIWRICPIWLAHIFQMGWWKATSQTKDDISMKFRLVSFICLVITPETWGRSPSWRAYYRLLRSYKDEQRRNNEALHLWFRSYSRSTWRHLFWVDWKSTRCTKRKFEEQPLGSHPPPHRQMRTRPSDLRCFVDTPNIRHWECNI